MDPSDLCRAEGNALSLHPSESASVNVTGNQISGEGDCLIDMECGGSGCSGVSGHIQDNEMSGIVRSDITGAKTTCSVWVEPALRGANLRFDGNHLRDLRSTGCPTGIKECSEKR
jgi:hypothetical protein